jgi:hypothetical protein
MNLTQGLDIIMCKTRRSPLENNENTVAQDRCQPEMEETMFRRREMSISPSVNSNLYFESYMKISSV